MKKHLWHHGSLRWGRWTRTLRGGWASVPVLAALLVSGTGFADDTLVIDGSGQIQTAKGLRLDALDRPLITRSWNPFTSGPYDGIGRWGLFLEPHTLVFGVSYDNPLGGFAFHAWRADGKPDVWMSLKREDGQTNTPTLRVRGTVVAETKFEGLGTMPVGGIIMWSGAMDKIPAGWALCDGGNGTPDLRSRFIVGASSPGTTSVPNTPPLTEKLDVYFVGNSAGEQRHTLSVAEMPSHTHSINGGNFVIHQRSFKGDDGSTERAYKTDKVRDGDSLLGGTDPTGSGQPHENRPPYYALAFIMRTK